MTPVFVHLPYSPWSERAAWALDFKRVPHESRVYSPIVGEPRLRAQRRGTNGPPSVPVLLLDDRVITDSDEIARWADAQGTGPTLFPDDAKVREWEAVAEQALQAGRALGMRRVLKHGDALLDLVPRSLRWMGPVAKFLAWAGAQRTLRKYGGGAIPDVEHRRRLVEALDKVRAGLANSTSTPKTLLGTFSYADMTVAQTLVFVWPPEPPPKGQTRPGIRVSRASRKAFRDPELAEAYADLAAWRDTLYETWRRAP